jgi:acetone carboxylase gamma subunit
MKPGYNYGLCLECGDLIKRQEPADLAICDRCFREHNPPLAVEVELMGPEDLMRLMAEKFFKDHPEIAPSNLTKIKDYICPDCGRLLVRKTPKTPK